MPVISDIQMYISESKIINMYMNLGGIIITFDLCWNFLRLTMFGVYPPFRCYVEQFHRALTDIQGH